MSKSIKYYCQENSEIAYPLSYFVDIAFDQQLPIKVELQKREIRGEMSWCIEHGEFVVTCEDCGRICKYYDPRNGKNGCCKYVRQGFIGTGKFYNVHPDGKVEEIK